MNTSQMAPNSSATISIDPIFKSKQACLQFFYFIGEESTRSDILMVTVEEGKSQLGKFNVTGAKKGGWHMGQFNIEKVKYAKVSEP